MRGTSIGRCLALLLALCLTAQAAALVVHVPVALDSGSAPAGERGGDHAPDTCDLCQILSHVRVQAPSAALEIGPLVAFTRSVPPAGLGFLAPGPQLSAPGPRAPPPVRSPELI
ncbi:MAG: hypothetical protein ACQGVK_05610 [Myxococcota bacterium]